MNRYPALGLLAACVVSAALLMPAAAAEPVFPVASPIGLVPPPGLAPSASFQGFEDRDNGAFIRLIALPGKAFAEIEKNLTDDALRKQGLTIDKRESFALADGKGLLLVGRQQTKSARIRKWLLIAPVIRAALATLTVRTAVPAAEQLALVPFKVNEMAGMRLVRVVPGVAVQLTDGPQDTIDAPEQAHLVISIAAGGPQRPSDRGHFARAALSGLPPLKDVHIVNSEPMRIGGQPGHEMRAEGTAPQTGTEVKIVQWLRFGSGGYMRILGIAPKENWTETFMRFRAVRDGLEPR